MKVRVEYRNYAPLYSGYCSFWTRQDPELEFELAPLRSGLQKIFRIYRLIRNLPGVPQLTTLLQSTFFPPPSAEDVRRYDAYFYTGMLPEPGFSIPYVVDYEHASALFNFAVVNEEAKERVFSLLNSPNCRATLPWSRAAEDTLQRTFPDRWESLRGRSRVLYPAIPLRLPQTPRKIDPRAPLKLLFIGKEHVRKGLPELLEAVAILLKRGVALEFECVSDLPEKKRALYRDLPIRFYDPKFSLDELTKRFYWDSDLFVLPTHEDTFGMVLVEAMAMGLPILTTRQFAAAEIVRDGQDGFLLEADRLHLNQWLFAPPGHSANAISTLDQKLVRSLIEKIEFVAKHREILATMRAGMPERFGPEGTFSLERRHQALREIFLA